MDSTETNGRATTDIDTEETRDWLDSLGSVLRHDGVDRARFLLERLVAQAGRVGASPPLGGTTPYVNTIRSTRSRPTPATSRSSGPCAR